MKKSFTAALAFLGFGLLAATSASAQCVWVSCPNSPPPQQVQPPSQSYYPQNREVYRTQTYSNSSYDNSYNEGYSAGVRATKAKTKRTSHATGTSRRTSSVHSTSASSGRSHVAHNRSNARSTSARVTSTRTIRTQVYRAPVKRQTASTSVRRTTTSYRAPARQYSYSQNNYVQPYRNTAAAYNAPQYGNYVNIANYGGRGESWVTTSRQVVHYSTPHVITNDGGRSCGWGTQIAANGQRTSRQAYVCHCADGWLPQ